MTVTKSIINFTLPRIGMIKIEKSHPKFQDWVFGALKFTECEFLEDLTNLQGGRYYYYKHPTEGVLYCDDIMLDRINERLKVLGYNKLTRGKQ